MPFIKLGKCLFQSMKRLKNIWPNSSSK